MPREQIEILEILHLRLSRNGPGELTDLIDNVVRVGREEGVRVYRHTRIETDLLLHLHRDVEDGSGGPSELGSRLVSLLRDHGIVEHSVWIRHPGRPA